MMKMMIQRSFLVLILVNLIVLSSGSISVSADEEPIDKLRALDDDDRSKPPTVAETTTESTEEDTSESDSSEEDTMERNSTLEVTTQGSDHVAEADNGKQIELAKRRRPVSQPWHPDDKELFYEHDENGRVFNASTKYCAFFGQIYNATSAFLSVVPKNASEREARLKTSMHNEWKHRVHVVEDIVVKLILTPMPDMFAQFWRAFHDLDIRMSAQNSTEKKGSPSVLRRFLTKLTNVTTLQDAQAVWRQNITFWAKASTHAHQMILFSEAKSFSLSPVQRRLIREVTKLTPIDEANRRVMLKYPFYTAGQEIPESATRLDLMTKIYLTCLWVMRVEHQDPRVASLVRYLTTNWREEGILEDHVDQLFVMHSFCIGVSEVHMFYNVIDVPCSKTDGANVNLTRPEYDIYLDFIQSKFRSRINRDTARITLATFYNNGKGPVQLYEKKN